MELTVAIKEFCNTLGTGLVPTNEYGKWNINIQFTNSDGDCDETQFDIHPAHFDYGAGKCEELVALWKQFCKENGFRQNSVLAVCFGRPDNIWYPVKTKYLSGTLHIKQQEENGSYDFRNCQCFVTQGFDAEFGDETRAVVLQALNAVCEKFKEPDYLQVFMYITKEDRKKFYLIHDEDHVTAMMSSEY